MSENEGSCAASRPDIVLGADDLLRLHQASAKLFQAQTSDDLTRCAVDVARCDLGFDRVSLWMFDLSRGLSCGTYGIDELGAMRDERARSVPIPTDLVEDLRQAERWWVRYDPGPLRDERGTVVGMGVNVAAAVRDAENIVGVVFADNLLAGGPISDAQCDLLSLYASIVGPLYSRRRAEEALRASADRQARFQQRLLALHGVTTELSTCSSLDELYRKAIQLGFERLGRRRLGLWIVDAETDEQVGTYGIDESGHLRDERSSRVRVPAGGRISRARSSAFRWDIERGVPLRNGSGDVVGVGTSICAPVWDGTRVLGALFADDLGCSEPIGDEDGEVLALFATSLGHLATRLCADEERAALEMKLQHAQKMESVGRLAGGVAHDFNNLLTSLLGNALLALDLLPDGHPARSHLENIRVAGEAAAELTRKLLAFSRRQVVDPRVFDLNSVAGGMQAILRRLIGEHIELRFSLSDGIGAVRMDPGQLEQILVNLVVNARDAMPGGGILTVATGQVQVSDDGRAASEEAAPGTYVTLSVSDTGVGIDPNTLPHIFEPFFTTKEQGEGTGLGLATVYGIAAQNGGFVTVRSDPGRGSRFCVHLPVAHEEPAPSHRATRSPCSEPKGAETVLLVEDDAMLRELAAAGLRRLGYTVIECSGPQEALSALETNPAHIDLLLTDVVMPHMNGRDLSIHVRRKRPDVRVLFMSGYAEDVVAHNGVLEEEVNFIGKPFRIWQLGERVRAVLDA